MIIGIVVLLFIIGISGGNEQDSPPATTTPEAPAPAGPPRVTVPGSLVGKNTQLVDNELRKLGIVDINYTPQDAASTFTPLLETGR
ncbi:MAG: hypothetical protein M3143_02580 [Actinomycetota bacterium]|nr:hypothetical protein [Actinomycetota bacterium]